MGLFSKKKNESKQKKVEKQPETQTKTVTEKKTINKEEKKAEKKPIYRVLYDKENRVWIIKKDGAKRVISSFVTKDEALNRVKELSMSNDMNFIVHKKDGKFQRK